MNAFRSLIACSAVLAAAASQAAEIEVLSAVGFKMVMAEVAPQFEQATGHHLILRYGTLGDAVKRVQAGESADVIVIPTRGLEQLAESGKVARADISPIARSVVAMAVRSGTAKPDISSADAFRKAMLEAKTVMLVNPAQGGASYAVFRDAFERLGIMEQMKPKIVHMRAPGREGIAREAADGRVDVALNQMQELAGVQGLDIVGPLPAELQQGLTFSAAPTTASSGREAAARAFVAFLRAPERAALIRSKGLQPAT